MKKSRKRTHTLLSKRLKTERHNWPMHVVLSLNVLGLAIVAIYLGDQPRSREPWLRRLLLVACFLVWLLVGVHLLAILNRRFNLRRPRPLKAMPFGIGAALMVLIIPEIVLHRDYWLLGLTLPLTATQLIIFSGVLLPTSSRFGRFSPFKPTLADTAVVKDEHEERTST